VGNLKFTIRDLLWLTMFSGISLASFMAINPSGPGEDEVALFVIGSASLGAAIGSLIGNKLYCAAGFLALAVFIVFLLWVLPIAIRRP